MKRNTILSLSLALALSAGVVCIPVQAAPAVQRNADFGISYVTYSHYDRESESRRTMVTGAATRYEGAEYTAALEEMVGKLAAAATSGTELGAPDCITIDAGDRAEEQVAEALEYVPDTIEVQFDTAAEAKAFYDRYADWKNGTGNMDLWIQAIEVQDPEPLMLELNGNTVTCILSYAEGWLAYADGKDGLRVFEDEAWSDTLSAWTETYLDPIAEADATDAEKAAMVVGVLKSTTDYDHKTSSYEKGSDDFLTIHSMYGPIAGGRGVCDGYSYTFHYAMSYLGIPCFEMYGSNHAWNKVQIDGSWYVMDVANAVDSVWLTGNYVLTRDNKGLTPYSFMDWAEALYPCEAAYADRDSILALI